LDAVSAENRALRKRIDDLEKDVDANRRMAEDAMADAESAVGRVSIAERTAESSMLAKSEAVRQLNACQQRLADLERQLGDAQRSLDKCRSESRELQSERDALRAKTAELKSLVDSLDGSYKDGGARLSRALMAIDEHKSAIQRLESSNSSLQQQIRERDDRIASLVRSLSDIDMDRDNLQAQLDARDEAASASDDVRVRAERAVEDYRVRLSESELKIRMLNDELASSRRQAAVTDGRIATLKAELEECQRRFNMSYSEMNHAAEELRLMTSENQAITSELAQVSYERDRLRERVTELGVVASSEQDARRWVDAYIYIYMYR
jgi:chromosome segregation ATPase